MRLIVLWDIDHTLIENSGVSKEIYAGAFKYLTGHSPSRPARTEGRTDRLIMRGMFANDGLPEPTWDEIERALIVSGQERLGELRNRGMALPGAREILKAVANEDQWISSVLTGNISANAYIKLSAFGMDELLDLEVGGYGADADERFQLVPAARERIIQNYDVGSDVPIVLVGDTPLDVVTALTNGCEVIAVASGVHKRSELVAAGATTVLSDLSDTTRLLSHLRTLTSPH